MTEKNYKKFYRNTILKRTLNLKLGFNVVQEYVMKKIDERYHPDGYNVGINIGEAAGQSVFHCHMHVIPRYKGDVPNPKGGVRGVIPSKQSYSVKKRPEKPSTSAKNDKPSETETL